MPTVKIKSRVDAEGNLTLKVPARFHNQEVEVMVTAPEEAAQSKSPEELGWPPGFFEQT